jgi:peptidoglycan/xylan/chitin deacetylase (PgdA/CDA1 family)
MILMYHNIDHDAGFNTVSKSNFIKQLLFLKNNNYKIIALDKYLELVVNNKLSSSIVTITFDDAYINFAEIVFSILKEYQIPVTLFVPVGFIDKYNEWDAIVSQTRLKIMNWENLKILANNDLITIGSHGFSHCSLGLSDKEKILFEVSESKRILEETLHILIRHFSFPYGQKKDISFTAIQALKDNSYVSACSTNWCINNKSKDLFRLNRIEIEPADNIEKFESKVKTYYHPKFFKQILKNILSIVPEKNIRTKVLQRVAFTNPSLKAGVSKSLVLIGL